MATRRMSQAEYLARLSAATLGRNSGPELFYSYGAPMTTGGTLQTQVPRPLALARPLASITVRWAGRIVIAGANYTAGVPEAPQTLIERIQIQGTHNRFQFTTPIDISGPTAFAWQNLYQRTGNDLYIGANRSDDPGIPFVSTVGLTNPVVGTYDVDFFITVPLYPMMGGNDRTAVLQQIPFLWKPQDWKNDLTIKITTGDQTSLGTPAGGTTVTWTSYGAATGTPTVYVYLNYWLLGSFRNDGTPSLTVRTERLVNPALVAAVQNQRLVDLQKQITTAVVLKTGQALTGMSSGCTPFSSLSDRQLDNTKISVDNKRIRDTPSNLAVKQQNGLAYNTVQPQGYFQIPFADGMEPLNALRGDLISPGAEFAVYTDFLTGGVSANAVQRLVQEQVFGGPFDATM